MLYNASISRRKALIAGLGSGLSYLIPSSAWARDGKVTSIIETATGKLRGLRSGGVSRFLGIPYGDDTASRRFQPAQAAPAWTGIRDCVSFGNQAPQGTLAVAGQALNGKELSPIGQAVADIFRGSLGGEPESEDCLYLNVFTPDASMQTKRPVMVWLHGGGFAMGSGSTPAYDGGGLCRRGDVVVVTINHRLNAMGYLYLGAFHEDFADSGNVGQLDIVLALQWVRDNIAAFGGDPDNVTIFGESGGGAKAGTLLGMPPGRGLFNRAIQQSGAAVKMVDKSDALEHAERTLAALGVAPADVHKLQEMEFRKVIAAASAIQLPPFEGTRRRRTLAPVVDGRALPAHPFDPVATEVSRDVPLIIGTNKDESTLFLAADPAFGRMTEDQARARFSFLAGERGASAFELYRSLRPDDPPTYWVTSLMTDLSMRANSIIEAERKAAQEAAPVFMYRVDWEAPLLNYALRSPHGIEVPFVFDNLDGTNFIGDGPEPQRMAALMSLAWINFARNGNPSQKGLSWSRYEKEMRETMIFDIPSKIVSDPDRETREFWTGA